MGHPDKMADYISDSILNLFLQHDPQSHVAVETLLTKDTVVLSGEVSSTYNPLVTDLEDLVRDCISYIGYNSDSYGFNADTVTIYNLIHAQSPDINQGVKEDEGAGDQGNMFGYATNETPECLPLSQVLANTLVRKLDEERLKGNRGLRPDTKSQVTVAYDDDGKPSHIDSIVLAISHQDYIPSEYLHSLAEQIISSALKEHQVEHLYSKSTKVIVNGTGKFVVCGPASDTGLTGRKIVVDQTNAAPVGGGAFSGKDPSKVDRSAAYMCRYIAKALVVSGIASEATVSMSYCIGKSQPTHFDVSINPTGLSKFSQDDITRLVKNSLDLSVKGIIERLNLRNIDYTDTTFYSHYGKSNLPWENVEALVKTLKTVFL